LIAVSHTSDLIDRNLVFEFLVARHRIHAIAAKLLAVHGNGVGFAGPAVIAGISVQPEKRQIESTAAGSGSEIAQMFEFSHLMTPSFEFVLRAR
jgi:hypothetical protein